MKFSIIFVFALLACFAASTNAQGTLCDPCISIAQLAE
jgi:hypothetical protein